MPTSTGDRTARSAATRVGVSLLAQLALVPPAFAGLSNPVLLPGDDAVGQAAGAQFDSALARGDGAWLAVWSDTRAWLAGTLGHPAPGEGPDLYGIRLDATGAPIDAVAFPVASGPWFEGEARVSWNGADWLVAYNADRPTPFYFGQDVLARRVDALGGIVDPSPLLVVGADDREEWLWDVASDGSGWALLWQDVDATGATYVLDGTRIPADGTVTPKVRVYTPVQNTYAPWNARLEWAADRYLVAWDAWKTDSSEVYGLLIDASLAARRGPFALTGAGTNDVLPAVATDGSSFYVAWTDHGVGGFWGGVEGTPVSAGGVVGVPDGEGLSEAIYPMDPHPGVAWAGDRWGTVWESYDGGAGTSLYYTGADPTGAPDPARRLVGGADLVTRPAVEPTDDGVLATWTDVGVVNGWTFGEDLHALASTADGVPGPISDVSLGAPAQTRPELAAGAAGHLLVARSETAREVRILAWTLDARGQPVGVAPIQLDAGTGVLGAPAVAWNGSVYLVVWDRTDPATADTWVWGKRVLPDGTVLDPSPVRLMESNEPALAARGESFLVVGSWLYRDHEREIRATRVTANGGLTAAPPVRIGGSYATGPDVAATSQGWLVAWQRAFSHDSPYSEARGAVVGAGGQVGPELLLGAFSQTPDQTDVSVAANADLALVSFADGPNVAAVRVDPRGSTLGGSFLVSGAPNRQFDTDTAWNGRVFAVTWTDWRLHPEVEPGEGDVYAARVTRTGQVLDPAGFPLAADPSVPEGNAVVVGRGGEALFAWTRLHEEAPFAAFRIETAFASPGP